MMQLRIPQVRKQKEASYESAFRIVLLIASAIVISCTTTDYIGKKYPKTDRVEIFFSTDEIKRPYEIMDQIKAEAPEAVKFEVMEQQLVKDAMENGADAILIGELKTVEVGSVTSASGKTYGDPHYYLDKNMKLKKKGGCNHYSQISTTTIVYVACKVRWRLLNHGESQNLLDAVFPPLKNIKFSDAWGGPVSMPIDMAPAIGYLGDQRVVYSLGCVGHGVSLTHLNGQTVRDLVLERQTDLTDVFL